MNKFIVFLLNVILPAHVVKHFALVEKCADRRQFSQTFIAESNLFSLYISNHDLNLVPNITNLDFILQSKLLEKVIYSTERKNIYCQLEDCDILFEINKSYFDFLYLKLSDEISGKVNFAFNLLLEIDKIFPSFAEIIASLNDVDLSKFFLEMLKNSMITEDMLRAIMVHLKESRKRIYDSLPGHLKDSLNKEVIQGLKLNMYWIEQSLFISQLNSYTLFLNGKLKAPFFSIYKSLLSVYHSSVISRDEFGKKLLQIKNNGKLQLALSQGKSHDWINIMTFLNEDEILVVEKASSKRNFRYLLTESKYHQTTESEFILSAYNLIRLFVELKNEDEGNISLDDLVSSVKSKYVFNWILWEMGLVRFISALKTLKQKNYKLVLADLSTTSRAVLNDIVDSKIILLNKNGENENRKAKLELKSYLLFLQEIGII